MLTDLKRGLGSYFRSTNFFLAGSFSHSLWSLLSLLLSFSSTGPLRYCLHRPFSPSSFLSFLPFFITSFLPYPFSSLILNLPGLFFFVLDSFTYPCFSVASSISPFSFYCSFLSSLTLRPPLLYLSSLSFQFFSPFLFPLSPFILPFPFLSLLFRLFPYPLLSTPFSHFPYPSLPFPFRLPSPLFFFLCGMDFESYKVDNR